MVRESIYHILNRKNWNAASGYPDFRSGSLEVEGFIHCSTFEQVPRVAETFFHGQENLMLLVIDPTKLESKLVWEPGVDKPDELFPHIYGPVNSNAIIQILDLFEDSDGRFRISAVEKKPNDSNG